MEPEEEPRHKDADRIISVMRKFPDILKVLRKLESLEIYLNAWDGGYYGQGILEYAPQFSFSLLATVTRGIGDALSTTAYEKS